MAQATKTRKTSENGQAVLPSGPVAERVAKLHEQARNNPKAARDEAWGWINELGRRAAGPRGRTRRSAGHVPVRRPGRRNQRPDRRDPRDVDDAPMADKVVGTITNAWMPWLGKKFDPAQKTGLNTLTNSARWPAKILWPLYPTQSAELGRSAFDFKTYVEAGRLDPSVDVLVIDYASVKSNPTLLIRQIRDELVKVVPGANLGKMLVNVPGRSEPFPALYFALKSDL